MSEKFAKLLTIKSIVTLVFTIGYVYLAVISAIDPDQYNTIFTAIIGFYFGTQHEKSGEGAA